MDKTPSSNSSIVSRNDTNSMRSKLRRLRIQENLILQSLIRHDAIKYVDEDIEITDTENDYKQFLNKHNYSYTYLKNVYDEVKINTNLHELLVDLDIDDMKKKVFELETSIKTLKSNIRSELTGLKQMELELNKQILEKPNAIEKNKRQSKTQSANNYNAIVPSPVRVMMTSPFKCSEVQQFQEFMKNSHNQYGGWNEYNHNIFVKYWNKYFGYNRNAEFESEMDTETFGTFVKDAIPKLQGVTISDITSHVKWYQKYLFFKEQQQNAINKWKGNKSSVKNVTKKVKYAEEDKKDLFPIETTLHERLFIACSFNANQRDEPEVRHSILKKSKSRSIELRQQMQEKQRPNSIMKSTKQWLNRIHHDEVGIPAEYNTIEHAVQKLHTPFWRLGL